MATNDVASFSHPETTAPFRDRKGRVESVIAGDTRVTRLVLEPGWRWSEHARADGATGSCMEPHLRYVVSGNMAIVMDDGTETVYTAGDVQQIAPGHDGYVVGDEPVVLLEWGPAGR